ncbi:MAG: hypothetical protein ACTSUQ_07430, partial [Candidatus Freyarchaeota archaeon]
GLTEGSITLTIDGTMETDGEMTITDGEISIPGGSMVMNATGSYIASDVINVTGDRVDSLGTTEVNGDTILRGDDFEIAGSSFIRGPVSISGSLDINGGTMKGTGTIVVSDGYMRMNGNLRIRGGTVEVLDGSVVMSPTGTSIGSETSITGTLTISGTVINSGLVKMSGDFQILVPLTVNGLMLTTGVTSMGSMGAINGILSITGNVAMSGGTIISGDNNVAGTMTVTPGGIVINGIVGLTGVIHTVGGMPAMSSSTVLELASASMMGLPVPHVSLLASPWMLFSLAVLGFGTVWVVARSVYLGIRERKTLVENIGRAGEALRNQGRRLREAVGRIPGEVRRRISSGG